MFVAYHFVPCSTRNEKYLAAVAAGKWVLHKSFLEASREAGYFVDEAPHEWGQENPGEPHNKLAAAARRWRLKLRQERAVSQMRKPSPLGNIPVKGNRDKEKSSIPVINNRHSLLLSASEISR